MKDEPKIRPIKQNGEIVKWEVDYGEDEYGVRRRPTFPDEAAAEASLEAYNKLVKTGGKFWAELKPADRNMVVAVLQEIAEVAKTKPKDPNDRKPFNLRHVWEDWKTWNQERVNTAIEPTIYRDAVKSWRDRKLNAGKSDR